MTEIRINDGSQNYETIEIRIPTMTTKSFSPAAALLIVFAFISSLFAFDAAAEPKTASSEAVGAVATQRAAMTGHAQKISANYNKVSNGYNFWLVEPEVRGAEKRPVVIFLHGASLCGTDMNKVRRYGTLAAVEKGRKIDAYVIAPQNPGGSWQPVKIMNILKWVEANYNVDSDRVYVLGMSLGGYGTIDFAATYPDKVAAAMAFCGGGTVKDLSGLGELPLWIVHGTADRAVGVSESDRVVAAVKKSDGSRLYYDRMSGWDHGKPARLFYLAETYDWLFSHRISDKNRPAARKFAISSELLRSAYAGLNHRAGYRGSSKASATKAKKSSARKSRSYASRKSGKKRA